jgi:5-methylthioribose kinase
MPDHAGYEALSLDTVAARIDRCPGVRERLGGGPGDWAAREVGDGNLNFVYIVEGPAGSVCVKQALPYVRLVGESWPLPLSRSFFEAEALAREAEDAGRVPALLHVDGPQALIVMENLRDHVVWRRALIARRRHDAAPVLGRFLAETLFRSSDLALDAATRKRETALFAGNTALLRITEDLVFTDPYREHPLNRWTSPELDADAARVRGDVEWKVAVQGLKHAFLTRAEALLHGDLHTGSVMVSDAGDARVIDPEFAFYGPMGFDVGALLANLWLNAFAQDGHGEGAEPFQTWVLEQAQVLWDTFAARFAELWQAERTGDAWPRALFEDQGQSSEPALEAVLARVQIDALGFAGAKMARRILGLAGVADLETIERPALRAACERRALAMARALVVEREAIGTVAGACERARAILEGAERPAWGLEGAERPAWGEMA